MWGLVLSLLLGQIGQHTIVLGLLTSVYLFYLFEQTLSFLSVCSYVTSSAISVGCWWALWGEIDPCSLGSDGLTMFFIVCFGVLGLLKTADEPFSRTQLIFLPAGLCHILMAAHLLAGDILFLNSMAQCSTGSSKIRVYIMLGTNFVAAVCMAWAKWKGVLVSLQDDPGVEDIVPNTLVAFPHHAVHKFFSGRASCSTRITRADTPWSS